MIYQLTQTQIIPASIDEVWEYFATPKNLNQMTPPEMNFEIIRGANEAMYAGQMIEYKVELISGIKTRWLTEITHVVPELYFVDEQRLGPYRLWHHEHHFAPVNEGVEMTDTITYALPFGLFGDIVHAIWVQKQLNTIFTYRRHKVEDLFSMEK
jgi:ligand-binding SRPBCC domain-containing protein